jgi:hypothetical protein
MTTEELKQQRAALFWWMSPRRDELYRWWWGYQRVAMQVLPESEKQKYLEKMNSVGN